jgi:spermidine synthase
LVLLAVSVAWLAVLSFSDLRAMVQERLYPGQRVVSVSETPYGQVLVTKTGSQFNFYENGMLLFSSGNEIVSEENVHYAMVQHPAPRKVLLISGGYAGTLAEILKYRPDIVDYVELNPALVEIARSFTRQVQQPAVRVHETDARRFIRKSVTKYDVVLVNLPAPATLQINRYYSLEFMREVARKMNPGAVIAFSLPAGADYVSREAGQMNTLLRNTLKQCFPNVLIVPGGRNYFLASGGPLSLDIPGLVNSRGIETVFVNSYYLDLQQMKERSAAVSATRTGSVNTDFSPVAVWYQSSWWLSHFGVNPVLVLVVFLGLMILLILTLNPVSAGLFAGGFTLASTEMILVFGLQVLCGYLFLAVGALIMVFMLGLAAGAGLPEKFGPGNTKVVYRRLQVALGLLALVTPFVLHGLSTDIAGDWLVDATVALLAFILAFIAGLEFRVAGHLSQKTLQKTVAGNYSAEMFGSAAGAFSVALFLIPAIGIAGTGILLALLNMATAISLYRFKKN